MAAAVVLFSAAPATSLAENGAWTVDDAVTQALSRPELATIRESGLRGLRAEVGEITARPTPRLELSREDVGGDEGVASRELSAMVGVPFDLVPWRGRMEESLRHRESAFHAEDDDWRLGVASIVRSAFFGVRYHEQRAAALERWVGRLDQGLESLVAREQRGDASTYEVRRVERELHLARAEKAREESRLGEAWSELRSWCFFEVRPQLAGDLVPTAPSMKEGDELPHLVRLEHLGRSLDAEIRASGAPFLRGWEFAAGYRYAEAGSESGDGALLSLSVPLALWNPEGARRDRLRAEQTRIGSELERERLRTTLAVESGADGLVRLLDAVAALPPEDRDAEITGQAEIAYAAGEATLTELLDAYESEAELDLARIDLQWEARRASIELDRRRGMGVPR